MQLKLVQCRNFFVFHQEEEQKITILKVIFVADVLGGGVKAKYEQLV